MKILITSFTYHPCSDGVAEATRFLAELLARNGHKVTVATSWNARRSVTSLNGVEIVSFKIDNVPIGYLGDEEEVLKYRSFILEFNPDLLISECWDVWSTILSESVVSRLKCPKIMISHGLSAHLRESAGPPPFFGFGQWLRGFLWVILHIPRLIARYDLLVFLDDVQGMGRFFDQAIAKFLKPQSITIIPNTADVEKVASSHESFRIKHGINEGPMALCVANYSPRKNQELAIRAFCEAGVNGSTLVCIGSESNDYYKRLEVVVRELSPESKGQKIFLLKDISRSEIMSAYSACDLVILTARAETQPIVLIEAMAFGKPWLSCTRSGCVPRMEGGYCIPDRKRFVNKLRSLLLADDQSIVDKGREGSGAFQGRYSPYTVSLKWTSEIENLF